MPPVDRRASNLTGLFILLGFLGVTGLGLALAVSARWELWLAGQLVLGISCLQWLTALHEAGHGTLFSSRRANLAAGHLASLFTGLPFHGWRPIHQQHHIWAGWQDLDPTTQSLVPRPLSAFERLLVNVCWRAWVPLFALLYRLEFWRVPRVLRRLRPGSQRRSYLLNTVALGLLGLAGVVLLGPWEVLRTVGPGLWLGLVLQEPITLSQHTHLPLELASGREVRPFRPQEQVPYTRSLRFPAWISLLVLLGFDAHELHHAYPNLPGWRLRRLEQRTANEYAAWSWIRRARALRGEVFLFQNRQRSGADV